jgi:TonB family protein
MTPGGRRGGTRPGGRLAPVLAVAVAMASAACGGEPEEVEPEVISLESPYRYPVELWDAGAEGETIVMVHVTRSGGVDSVYVLEGSGHAALDSAALAGTRELRFAPGRRGDRRVDMWAKLPVRFRARSAQQGDNR